MAAASAPRRAWTSRRGRCLPRAPRVGQGFISERTLELVQELRQSGHLFVLITGARSSTFLERSGQLPAADAYVVENGGRIFLPSADALTAAPLVEDTAWRRRHEAAPMVIESMPPSERPGVLWELYRRLQKEGWVCDARQYYTCFRVNVQASTGKTAGDIAEVISGLSPLLASSFNLGHADFYPCSSGKDKAAEYLMETFGFGRADCLSIGDDDNDLELAKLVGHTYVTCFTSESMKTAVAARPEAFTVAARNAFEATHEVLERIKALA